ncbi:MAG: porin [Planctomycetota bacterium]|jgi:phosphate-selective porin OprO/OprP|nr:porin [Planctomycetota bacterium]MDP6941669.1 porin [Planctomycetota bacterium]
MLLATVLLIQGQALAPLTSGGTTAPTPQVEKTVTIFGRLQSDFTLSGAAGDEDASAVEFRRVRIGAKGNLSAAASYKVELDFASSSSPAKFADAYLQLKNIGPGAIKIGHFKEPFGLDELTSSRFITFMERSVVSGFAPARNHGIMMSNSTEELTWQAGTFWDADAYGEDSDADNNTSLGARVVYRPWVTDKGRTLLHLGASLQKRDGTKAFKAYPGSHESGSWSTTLTNADTTGLELAYTDGPLSLMGEYASTDSDEGEATAKSAQVSWFMGDQFRGYKTSSAAFERTKGASEGAWELAARWGDYDFSAVAGGNSGQAKGVAVNWYVDSNTRVMVDSTTVEPEGAENYSVMAVRFAFDF